MNMNRTAQAGDPGAGGVFCCSLGMTSAAMAATTPQSPSASSPSFPIILLLPLLPLAYFIPPLLPYLKALPMATQLFIVLSPVLSYWLTYCLLPPISRFNLKADIWGKDLGKKGTSLEDSKVPESGGLVNGVVFIIVVSVGIRAFVTDWLDVVSASRELLTITSALFSVCFMLFLGFTDDVLDWPWRYKLFLPAIASIPLLSCYDGSTSILLPSVVRPLLFVGVDAATNTAKGLTAAGSVLASVGVTLDLNVVNLANLGWFYLLYMSLLSVFTTNAINIYSGINGLEAGQSYIIAIFIIIHNVIELSDEGGGGGGGGGGTSSTSKCHLFSLLLALPFLGGTAALLSYNWYPARIFVGDTFCYYAGMTFAVLGIHGHFSKTVLLFFAPQVLNFVLSLPQLAGLVPCPRHRLPKFNSQKGLMEPSTFPCKPGEYKALRYGNLGGGRTSMTSPFGVNLTVVNLALQIGGDRTEKQLCTLLLGVQAGACAVGLMVRYGSGKFFFKD